MVTISETFNLEAQQAHDNIFMIPVWILLILQTCEARDKKKRKRLVNQQRGFYQAEIKKQRQRYERQIRAPSPQFRITSPHF